ncbi:hypothetical protein BGX28_000761, partial [Mortierella sp. GBA30]
SGVGLKLGYLAVASGKLGDGVPFFGVNCLEFDIHGLFKTEGTTLGCLPGDLTQIYPRIYIMLPDPDLIKTVEGQILHQKLDEVIKESWSLNDVPDIMLIAIYLNPRV